MVRLLVLGLLASCLGCGSIVRVRGAIGSQVISGSVSTAQVSLITDQGLTITITLVTFLQNGINSSLSFCGDQSSQFIPGESVQVSFTPAQPCANVLQVIITGP